MRIVVDAMCAEFGGIRTYAEQLLGRWARLYPHDEVHVVLRAGSDVPTPGLERHELSVRTPDVLGRPWAQATGMHRLQRRVDADAVLALAPTTNVRRMRAPLVAVIHDLRAEIHPDEFSRGRRLLRRLSYGRTYQLASAYITVSQRSLDDLHRLHPATRRRLGTVIHEGADHTALWPEPTRSGPAVAFAHHSNKNPELLIAAWALARDRGVSTPPLMLLGVSSHLRPTLTDAIDRAGLGDQVSLAPYLADDEFRRTLSSASMIAFPSSFEGFGLPIVEGMITGKPVIIGPDPGCLEIAGGHGWVAEDWTVEALANAITRAADATPTQIEAARTWANTFAWDRTVRQTRETLATTAKEGRRP